MVDSGPAMPVFSPGATDVASGDIFGVDPVDMGLTVRPVCAARIINFIVCFYPPRERKGLPA